MLKDYFGNVLAAGQKALLIGRRGSQIEKSLKIIERVGLETVSVKDVNSGRRSSVTVTDNLVIHPDFVAREASMLPIPNGDTFGAALDAANDNVGGAFLVAGSFVNNGYHAI